jgi:lambda repressor-like predicted transcriptional regulator
MDIVGRTLSPAVVRALTYWPTIVNAPRPAPVDLTVLPPFFNDLLGELPWWNPRWQVTQVEPAYPREVASDHDRQRNRCTEVSVPGTLDDDAGRSLPFSARVRFEGDRLLRVQAKIADTVLSPALAPTGAVEPHPFGAVLRRLMDHRGVSMRELAFRTRRSMSTIVSAQAGGHNPHPVLVREIAHALEIPPADLAAIAGVDDAADPDAKLTGAQHGDPAVGNGTDAADEL